MTPPANPLLHVGYHKTATTWLQRGLFQEEAGAFYPPLRRKEVVDAFIRVNAFEFDPLEIRALYSDRVRVKGDGGLVPVMSHEQLAGNAHTGGHNSRAIADRLVATFPDARVLILIREQQSMILSVYKQYVRAGGVASLSRYVQPPRRGNDRGIPLFRPSFLEYHHLVAYYQGLFGDENVLVLPFETLRGDAGGFVTGITAFAGASDPGPLTNEAVNATISGVATALKRPVNLLLVRDALNPLAPVESGRVADAVKARFDRADRWIPAGLRQRADDSLRAQVRKRFAGRYAESNKATAALSGLDLAAMGYET
jgi:hypothetical protein